MLFAILIYSFAWNLLNSFCWKYLTWDLNRVLMTDLITHNLLDYGKFRREYKIEYLSTRLTRFFCFFLSGILISSLFSRRSFKSVKAPVGNFWFFLNLYWNFGYWYRLLITALVRTHQANECGTHSFKDPTAGYGMMRYCDMYLRVMYIFWMRMLLMFSAWELVVMLVTTITFFEWHRKHSIALVF